MLTLRAKGGKYMEISIIVIGIIVIALLIALLIKLFSQKAPQNEVNFIDLKNQLNDLKTKQIESQTNSLAQQQKLLLDTQKELREQLNQIMKSVGENLTATQGNINNQLKSSNEVISDIQKKLGSLEVTTKNIQEIGKDISSLQDILQAPKLRGNLGEYLLGELLKDILPPENYKLQYSFKNGTKVDAVIILGEGIVPVDSKFPLDSFQRLTQSQTDNEKKEFKKEFITSVKTRIDEIESKYINPAENTFDFAMMYIPAENVFYETIINDSLTNKEYELFNYAIKKHVIPVSPNSFYAYLMAIGYGLNGLKIEQEAKNIRGELSKVQDYFVKFYSDFTLLGKHIGNAENKYEDLTKKAEKVNDQMTKITNVKYDLLEDGAQKA